MISARPRRAQQSTRAVRLARLAVPGLLLGLATTGVVSATTGPAVRDAGGPPVVAASPSAAAQVDPRTSPLSRGLSEARPALTEAAAAKAARAKVTAAKEKAAALKAAEAKAAALKAAKAEAAALKVAKAKAKAEAAKAEAAQQKAARERAARERAAQAKVLAAALRSLDTRYTRVDLNVRVAADPRSPLLTVLDQRSRLSVTSVLRDGWRYVSYQGKGGWVKNQYLVDERPVVPKKKKKAVPAAAAATATTAAGGGTSSAACRGSSSVESGLTPDAVRVHRAICARFPSITAYGGVRADSLPEHPSGRALDAMVSGSTGWEVARWVRANAQQLGVSEVLFAQRIWTVQRSGEGWRSFSDRGSASANHYDHVHVSVYRNSGG